MTPSVTPKLPIPEPLRGNEVGSFAHLTVSVRLAGIAQQAMRENDFPSEVQERLQALSADLPYGKIRPLQDVTAPDAENWACYLAPHLGKNWLEVPWFFADIYFYRRILEATGYFLPGPCRGLDPFREQKRLSYEVGREAIGEYLAQANAALSRPTRDSLEQLLVMNVWGNQADLSVWAADQEGRPNYRQMEQQRAHLLVNQAATVADFLLSRASLPCAVDFLMDNAGQELACDLALADFLLTSGLASQVRLHLKYHPLYVSDAMIQDVFQMIAWLEAEACADARALAKRLKEHLETARLRLVDHLFWNSPLPMWQMPDDLRNELARADLILSKGDANYRRLIGDCHWAFTTPLADVLCYLPVPLAALRVLKAETVIGLSPGQPEALFRQDPRWLSDGRWGLIQFYAASNDEAVDESAEKGALPSGYG